MQPELASNTVNRDARSGPCFSLGNRMARTIWNLSWLVFCRYSPRPFHGWRNFWLRLFKAKLAPGVHIYPRVRIWAPWNLVAEEKVGVGNDAILYNMAPIHLGKGVVVSQGAHLCTGTHDFRNPGFRLVARPIILEEGVWVAAEAFVHPGVTLGAGSVIGARAVVTKDVPSGVIAAGNPAQIVGTLRNKNMDEDRSMKPHHP